MTYLPPLLTAQEFAWCVRLNVEVVRRKVRARKILATGRPLGIPNSELKKFNVSYDDAARTLEMAKTIEGLSRVEQLRVVRKMEEKLNAV